MKIGFANILYSKPDQRGGLGSHIADLSSQLAQRGHEVTIITSGPQDQCQTDDVVIVQIGIVDSYRNPIQLFNPIYIYQRLRYMIRLSLYIAKSGFDIVEFADGGFEHLFLIPFRRCAVITRLHGGFQALYNHHRMVSFFISKCESLAMKKSDGIISPSLKYAQRVARDYRIDLTEIAIIPYGIKTKSILSCRQIDFRMKYGIGKRKIVLISVGSSMVRKGGYLFIATAAKLLEHELAFIMVCQNRSLLNHVKLPDNLIVIDHQDRDTFYSLLVATDLMVFPSSFESFSIATREAMLLNKIIIVSPHIPMDDVASQYPRQICLQRIEVDELANAVVSVVSGNRRFPDCDATLREKLIQTYDLDTVAILNEKQYEEIIAARKRAKNPPG